MSNSDKNTMAVEINVNYTSIKGILKDRTTYKEETYHFYKDEEEDAIKAIPKLVRFIEKNNGYFYVRAYDHENIEGGTECKLLAQCNGFGRGTVTIGEYVNNNFNWENASDYSPKCAVEKIQATIYEIFYR